MRSEYDVYCPIRQLSLCDDDDKLVRRESDARVEKKIKLEDMLETEKR